MTVQPSQEAVSARLRCVTMNVYGPGNPDWECRHRLVGETLRRLDADVVALQEVPVRDDEVLEELLGSSYHVTPFSVTSDDGVGGLLATRGAHELVTEIDLRITARARDALPWTAAAIVALRTEVGEVIVTHHKPSWPFPFEAERHQQAVLVARALEDMAASEDSHVVVLGDFDATPDSASMSFWRGRSVADGFSVCYQDAWEYAHPWDPGYTFDLTNPLVREGEVATAVTRKIDHILVRSGLHGPTLRTAECRRILDGPVDGVWASDHYGVLADLVLPQNSPGYLG